MTSLIVILYLVIITLFIGICIVQQVLEIWSHHAQTPILGFEYFLPMSAKDRRLVANEPVEFEE